jgi:hypothetical protein
MGFPHGHGRGLPFALGPGKVLQRIAVCLVARNQFAHKLNLFMRNLVQALDFG